MVIEGFVLGSLPLVGASFGMPTSSVGPRVPPSVLTLTPSHSPHPLSLPPCCVLLPSCSLSLAMIHCFVVPTISFYYVLQCPPPLYYVLQWPPLIWGQGSFPAYSLCSQFVPSCSPHSPLAPSRVKVCYTMLWGPHHLWGQGVRGSEGSKRGVRGSKGSKRGQEGARGARGSEGSEMNVMLGFKAPTTSGGKNFHDDI